MREIKFRAWCKERKKMYEPNCIILNSHPKEKNPLIWANLWGYDIIEQKDIILHAEKIELMQFTGLKDKNGKEIYEGDIVEYEDCLLLIKWFSNGFGYEIIKQKNKNIIHDIRLYRSDEIFKIVGNIYEKPKIGRGT